MDTVTIRRTTPPAAAPANPLPTLLQTPAGLALLELQGTINVPPPAVDADGVPLVPSASAAASSVVPIGRLDFPDYDPAAPPGQNTAWMLRVHLYVGAHQRLTGEVKALPRPLAVVRRVRDEDGTEDGAGGDLEVVEVIRYKLLFSQRPEPMTESGG